MRRASLGLMEVEVDGLLGALKTREEDELKKKVEHRVTLYTPPPPFPSSLTSSNHRSFLGTNTGPHMAIPHGAYTPPWHKPARVALFSSACSFRSQRPSISGKSRASTRLRGRIVTAQVCKRRYVRMCFWVWVPGLEGVHSQCVSCFQLSGNRHSNKDPQRRQWRSKLEV